MPLQPYIAEELIRHPSAQPQDIAKLCYQAACGAEHMLSDTAAARAYLEREYAAVQAADVPLVENISAHVCRVSLAGWKYRGLPLDWLFDMFCATAQVSSRSEELLTEYLDEVEQALESHSAAFSLEEWRSFLAEYKRMGMPAVHHSTLYRDAEKPSYRIVSRRYAGELEELS